MKYDKFFELAKAAGIEECELYISTSHNLSFSLFHSEVDNYSDNNGFSIIARGLVNGKFGCVSCDSWSKEKAQYLVNEIVKNAGVIESLDPQFIFEGSEKYKKVNTFNSELTKVTIEEKLSKAKELETEIRAFDERIVEVQAVEYSESTSTVTLLNSRGLKLTHKSNYFVYVGAAVAKEGEQIKSGYEFYFGNDFSKFSPKELASSVGKATVGQLGGEPCESGTYKAVLSQDVVKSLMSAYIGSADAEEVQEQSSLFIGKLNQKVAYKKVTIEDRPLDKSLFARWFDDEGVATYNKAIIKNGVLQTYLFNLTTAAKAGTTTTGNGYQGGNKISTSPAYLVMKPGKKTQEELFAEVGNGVYITDVMGLHAGLNPQSGNFSLQSTGYLIKDGKKDRALDIITVSGNLMSVFMDIVEVGNDVKVSASGVSCPSVLIKQLAVSGK
jgi:PmbA protein